MFLIYRPDEIKFTATINMVATKTTVENRGISHIFSSLGLFRWMVFPFFWILQRVFCSHPGHKKAQTVSISLPVVRPKLRKTFYHQAGIFWARSCRSFWFIVVLSGGQVRPFEAEKRSRARKFYDV
jgi:hypothetical protein